MGGLERREGSSGRLWKGCEQGLGIGREVHVADQGGPGLSIWPLAPLRGGQEKQILCGGWSPQGGPSLGTGRQEEGTRRREARSTVCFCHFLVLAQLSGLVEDQQDLGVWSRGRVWAER